jgi:23S rRNA pseudouridine1911/1915/1917 synthase
MSDVIFTMAWRHGAVHSIAPFCLIVAKRAKRTGGFFLQVEMLQGALQIHADKRFVGWRLDDFMIRQLQLPANDVAQLFARKCVRKGSHVADAAVTLDAKTKITLVDPAPRLAKVSAAVTAPPILFEDDHVLVVHKAPGLIIHAEDPQTPTLDQQVAAYYEYTGQASPVLHVHRLDRPTTGAVVYAKHRFIARALDYQLTARQMKRRYFAVVQGARLAKKLTVDEPIARNRHQAGLYRVSSTGKSARTHFRVQAQTAAPSGHLALVKCELETGRTHQIRVHAAFLGAPIVGDKDYGGVSAIGDFPPSGQIALHAYQVTFYHPYEEQTIEVKSPLDEGWQRYLRQQWSLEQYL